MTPKLIRQSVLSLGLITILMLTLAGCGYLEDKNELATWVKKSMQDEIQKDDAYKGLCIGEVALVREAFSKFSGYVEFKYGADTEKANLTVTVDRSEKIYQCEPPRALILKRDLEQLATVSKMAETTALNITTGGRDETLEFIQPSQRFLDSRFLVRPGIDDLGGKSVSDFVSWLAEMRRNDGSPIKIKGWKQDGAFYKLYVELDEPVVLKLLEFNGGALLQPVKIYDQIIDPMEFVMLMEQNIKVNEGRTPSSETEKMKEHPVRAEGEHKEVSPALNSAVNASLKTTNTPATVRFECNAPEFQVFENNSQLTISNQQLTIPPLKAYTVEIRAEGYKPQTLTFKAAESGQDLGVKRIELLKVPIGGDPNAVSWQVINERWIKNTYKNGDITMGDRHSGNMWVYESTQSGKRDWDSASEYCKKFNYAGYSDWRLPEKEELHEMYKQKRLFPSTRDNSYWSSKFDAYDSECAWGVCMIDDCVGNVSKRGLFYAWPVRNLK